MPLIWINNRPAEDTGAPAIVSSTSISIEEGQALQAVLVFDRTVSGLIFNGGADDAHFQTNALTLDWAQGFLPEFGDPQDAGANNVYNTSIIAIGENGVNSSAISIAVTVTERVTPPEVGDVTYEIIPISDAELYLPTLEADNALSFQYDIDESDDWQSVPASRIITLGGLVTGLGIRFRGVNGGVNGAATTVEELTLLSTPALYNPNAVEFDGVSHLLRGAGLTSVVDGKQITVVLSFKVTGGDGTARRFFTSTSNQWGMRLQENNTFQIVCKDSSGTKALELITERTFLAGQGWQQLVISADVSTGAAHAYCNGAELTLTTETIADLNIDFTRNNISFGAATDGTADFTGIVSDCAFDPSYIDLDNPLNLRKFFYHNGRVRDPGDTGSNWFGHQAAVLFRGVTSTWHTNDGYGGGFTLTGTLTAADEGPNGSLITVTVTPTRSDAFIEFQSLQYNANWDVARAQDTDARALLAALFIRYIRGGYNNSTGRATLTALYDTYGIRGSHTFNDYDPSTGEPNTSAIDTAMNSLRNNLGLEKIWAIEGPNEFPKFGVINERTFSVNTLTDVLTTTRNGYIVRQTQGVGPTTNVFASASHGYTDGQLVQVRADTGAVLPAPLIADTEYTVRNPSAATLTLEKDGVAVNFTSTGTTTSSAFFYITGWAPYMRDFMAYLWNKTHTAGDLEGTPTEVANEEWRTWHTDGGGSGLVANLSNWERQIRDITALGDCSDSCDLSTLHLYCGGQPPHHYNRPPRGTPIELALTDNALNAVGKKCWLSETGYQWHDVIGPGGSVGGHNTIATVTEDVASIYTGREICEQYLRRDRIHKVNHFSLIDNLQWQVADGGDGDPHFGWLTHNASNGTFTRRKVYYTVRNLNSYANDATWNGTAWSYPAHTPSGLALTITPADNNFNNIGWFALEKSNGRRYIYIWNRNQVWDYNSNPRAEIAEVNVNCTVVLTGLSIATINVYDPTVVDADVPDTKRDTPAATPSAATLATSGVTVSVTPRVRVIELIPS